MKNEDIVIIESGKITISDPCYGLGTWCQAQDVEFPNGEYDMHYELLDGGYGRVKEISMVSRTLKPTEEDKIEWSELDYDIGVDSGQAGIFDSKYYEEYHYAEDSNEEVNEDWYDRVCDMTTEDNCAIIDNKGIVSSSGWRRWKL